MIATVRIGFFIDYSFSKEVESFFKSYDIEVVSPEKGRSNELRYKVPITCNSGEDLRKKVLDIIVNLKNKFNLTSVGEHFYYECNDSEYEQSPFFLVGSTGNSAKSNIDDKGNTLLTTTFCPECKLQTKRLTQNLSFDTSVLKNKYMINIGSQFWAVSERMAELMDQWDLKGYTLEKVIHKGKIQDAIPAYQLITESEMPHWSDKMKHYYFVDEKEEKCSYCGVTGRLDYPYHYDSNQISQIDVDIIRSKEFKSNGSYAYQTLLISKKFRDLLIKHKITRDVRSKFSENYGRNDWLLDPIIVVNDQNT